MENKTIIREGKVQYKKTTQAPVCCAPSFFFKAHLHSNSYLGTGMNILLA